MDDPSGVEELEGSEAALADGCYLGLHQTTQVARREEQMQRERRRRGGCSREGPRCVVDHGMELCIPKKVPEACAFEHV